MNASTRRYQPRPTRVRRSKAEIDQLCDDLFGIVRDLKPMTVRQVFYQATSRGLIDKTEAEYKQTIVRLLGVMRREGRLPYRWLADSTRWVRRPQSYSSLENALQITRETYRRSLWADASVRVEVWLEKDALAGVLYAVTAEWDVPLYVTRGYPSLSYLHEAAEAIVESGRPTHVYYFGDHDPSGLNIFSTIARDLSRFVDSELLDIQRVAVTEEQISQWNLLGRPTKSSDSRSRDFEGDSVEVDAIHPNQLRQIAADCILQHVDRERLSALVRIEEEERETLRRMSVSFEDGLAQ